MKKRIDEISMLKAIGIIMVMMIHMLQVSGVNMFTPDFARILNSISVPLMLMFFFLSGYTTSDDKEFIAKVLGNRIKNILLPYYKFAIVMLLGYAIIYLFIEGRSFDWYLDGALGILVQLQSFHYFDATTTGVHPMFYGVLIGWYLFQYVLADVIFIFFLNLTKGKDKIYKLVIGLLLLLAGAVLYKLNLQGLNGEFFPPVCKIIILPNIFAIAGVLLLARFLATLNFFKIEDYSAKAKIFLFVASILLILVFYFTDDYLYDFPIGKWGAFGMLSYLLSPVYALAWTMFWLIICELLKKLQPVKKALLFIGNNTMVFLVSHFFIGFVTAYIGGFWYPFLSEAVISDSIGESLIRFIVLMTIIIVANSVYILTKLKLCKPTQK